MNSKFAILDDRSILFISGKDTYSFLQGLITNNVPTYDPVLQANAKFSALLTPQGKILFDFFLITTEGGYLIDVSSQLAEELLTKLLFYRLRADVQIRDISESMKIVAVWDGKADLRSSGLCFEDPRFAPLGQRLVLTQNEFEEYKSDTSDVQQSGSDYRRYRISFGIPELGQDLAPGSTFPHDMCLDLLNGVDFNKGCFVGQEVVSRMRHRGTARKRIVLVRAQTPLDKSQPDIMSENRVLGTVISINDTDGTGIVRLDRVREALERKAPIYCGPVELQLRPPSWSNYELNHDGNRLILDEDSEI